MGGLQKAMSRSAGPVGLIGAVGGFISDVLMPLGNFAPWLAGLAMVGTAVFGTLFVKERQRKVADVWDSSVAGMLIISIGALLVFGVWSYIQGQAPENGYLASNIEPIAQIQASLLNLEQDVADIKETTTDIQETVNDTANQVEVAATAQAQGFADIQAAFASLQASQVLVENPSQPQEWYSNARLYQLKGNSAAAITAYEGYFTFNLGYIDPFRDYVNLLKSSEGIIRTRQIVGDLFNQHPDNVALELVNIELLDSAADRQTELIGFTQREPDFGPGFLALAQEYERSLRETPTTLLLERHAAAYNALFTLETNSQGYSSYFIDKLLVQQDLTLAHTMLESYAQAIDAFTNIEIQISYFAQGVQFMVLLPEMGTAQKLLFGIDQPDPAVDAGHAAAGVLNTVIGPIPNLPFGDHIFTMQYIDANGEPSDIISKPFRIDPIAIYFNQRPMDFSTGQIPGFFNLAIVGQTEPADYTYHYSIDSETLDQTFVASGFGATLEIPNLTPGEHTLYIQAVDEAGEKGDVVEFGFKVN